MQSSFFICKTLFFPPLKDVWISPLIQAISPSYLSQTRQHPWPPSTFKPELKTSPMLLFIVSPFQIHVVQYSNTRCWTYSHTVVMQGELVGASLTWFISTMFHITNSQEQKSDFKIILISTVSLQVSLVCSETRFC